MAVMVKNKVARFFMDHGVFILFEQLLTFAINYILLKCVHLLKTTF